MATTSSNFVMQGVRGSIGKQVVFRQYGNKTVISAHPDFNEKYVFTAKQLKRQKLMKEANMWATSIVADPAQRDAALLRLNVTRNRLYSALIGEFFKNEREKDSASEKNM